MTDRAFRLSKNLLDNEFQRQLAYLQIAVITLATLTISAAFFYLGVPNMQMVVNAIVVGSVATASLIAYYDNRLNTISAEIRSL